MLTNRWAVLAAALVVLLGSGLVHGLWSERWVKSVALEEALARVPEVPLTLGAWQGEPIDVDAEAYRRAGAQAYWARTYSRPDRESFLVILMCGRAGKMSIHTPEVCYRGAGFEMLDPPTHFTIRSTADEAVLGTFLTARFAKTTELLNGLHLYWTWNSEGMWTAADNPRWEFRSQPFLYKLYVSQQSTGPDAMQTAQTFLQEFLPALNKSLFPVE